MVSVVCNFFGLYGLSFCELLRVVVLWVLIDFVDVIALVFMRLGGLLFTDDSLEV